MEILDRVELVFRSVTALLAVIVIGVAGTDLRAWWNGKGPVYTSTFAVAPMFLIAVGVLCALPRAMSRFMSLGPVGLITAQTLTIVGLGLTCLAFYIKMVERLKYSGVEGPMLVRKAASWFAGILLLIVIGFYAI